MRSHLPLGPVQVAAIVLMCLSACDSSKEIRVQNGAYAFVWQAEGEGFTASVKRGPTSIAQLDTPFAFIIGDEQQAISCAGRAESVKKSGNGAIAKAVLSCPNGAKLRAQMAVRPATDKLGGFHLELRTIPQSPRGDGVAQSLRFGLPADPGAEALIPGVWYKRNEHVEDCVPSLSGGTALHVREDRATYPAVTVRSGVQSVSLFRENAAAWDALPAIDGSAAEVLFSGIALYTKAGGATDIAGIGFDLNPRSPSLAAHYPYFEGPYSMQLKAYAAEATPLFDPYCRYEPVQGSLDWELARNGGLNTHWRLILSEQPSFGALMSDHWRWAHALYRPAPRTPIDGDAVRNALASFVAAHYDYSSSLAGFFYVMTVPSATVLLPYFEPGFTGRTFLNARLLLEAGRETGRADWIAMAESVYDSWITAGTQGGFFYDLWDAKRNLPTNEKVLNAPPDGIALRREAEALWALIDAVADEERRGMSRMAWKDAARAHLDTLATLAQPDGSFCRRYTFERVCLDNNPGGTSAAIPALIHGYRLLGDERYLATADRAARFVADHFIEASDYYASTIDNPSENKEAATYAFYTARLMCEEKCATEPEWLELARRAADAALTWIQMTDVPFYAGTPLGDIGFMTRGLGSVAAGGGNIDAYAFEFPGSLVWLAAETNDRQYEEMARLILGAAMATVPLEGDMKGLSAVGLAPEGIQKTMFSYFAGGKGSYAPFSAIGWTIASVYQGMDEVERVSGMTAIDFLQK